MLNLPCRAVFLQTAIALLLAVPAVAAPAITCHCFEERAFDAAQPAAADAYFLASAQNSLFAALAGVEKKRVVRAKMTGSLAADLWVGWFLANLAEVKPEAVEVLRREGLSWVEVTTRLKLRPAQFDKVFAGILKKPGSTAELATAVVDGVLTRRCGANPAEVKKMRQAGADDQQAILAVFLGRKSGRRADDLFTAVKSGGATWGSLLDGAGVSAETLESEIRRLVH